MPAVNRLADISDKARMELVSFLRPFFPPEKKQDLRHDLIVVFDGLGVTLTTGIKGDASIDFNCVITKWTLLADQIGSIEIDIWKVPFAAFPPTSGNTIVASDNPTLSSQEANNDIVLPGWTTVVNAGDTFRFNINSVTSIARATLVLELKET